MDDLEKDNEDWRDVPVTFGELNDILTSIQIGVSGSVGYTHALWRESIKEQAKAKLKGDKGIHGD